MKFIVKVFLILFPSFYLLHEFPWWTVMIIAFIISVLIKTKWLISFFSSFLAIAGLWFYQANQIDKETGSILTKKIAELFMLNNPLFLIVVTAFVGGIAAGFGGLSGHTFRKLFDKKKTPYY